MIDGSTFRILGIPGILLINNNKKNLIFLNLILIINQRSRNIHAEMASSGLVPVQTVQVDNGIDEINHRDDEESGYGDPREHNDK